MIIGFANFDTKQKRLFEYEDIKGEAHEIRAKNINNVVMFSRGVSQSNLSRAFSLTTK